MLFRATPLILTGLSVAVAFKTGLFNIGAPGQYLMGTMATLAIALGIPSSALPGPVIWLLAFLGGVLTGALWGCIPGLVKSFLNINGQSDIRYAARLPAGNVRIRHSSLPHRC